jgi:hypothetical protein
MVKLFDDNKFLVWLKFAGLPGMLFGNWNGTDDGSAVTAQFRAQWIDES